MYFRLSDAKFSLSKIETLFPGFGYDSLNIFNSCFFCIQFGKGQSENFCLRIIFIGWGSKLYISFNISLP